MALEPESVSIAPVVSPIRVQGVPGAVESWVDQFGAEPDRVGELIRGLTALTLPEQPGKPDGTAVSPLRGDLDSQFWFWNRAANNFVEHRHFQAAAEIWSALYLTC